MCSAILRLLPLLLLVLGLVDRGSGRLGGRAVEQDQSISKPRDAVVAEVSTHADDADLAEALVATPISRDVRRSRRVARKGLPGLTTIDLTH